MHKAWDFESDEDEKKVNENEKTQNIDDTQAKLKGLENKDGDAIFDTAQQVDFTSSHQNDRNGYVKVKKQNKSCCSCF